MDKKREADESTIENDIPEGKQENKSPDSSGNKDSLRIRLNDAPQPPTDDEDETKMDPSEIGRDKNHARETGLEPGKIMGDDGASGDHAITENEDDPLPPNSEPSTNAPSEGVENEEGIRQDDREEGEVFAEGQDNVELKTIEDQTDISEKGKGKEQEYTFYNCQHCMSVFVSKRTLGMHLQEHLREKNEGRVYFKKSSLPLKKRGRGLKIQISTFPASQVKIQETVLPAVDSSYGRGKREYKAKDWNDYIVDEIQRKRVTTDGEGTRASVQEKHPLPIVTIDVPPPVKAGRPRKSPPRNVDHKCNICHKVLKNRQNLLTHLLCHSTERPYRCDICNKSYSRSNVLKIHRKTVHGAPEDRPCFPCEICYRPLASQVALRSHVALHFNENQHECEECGEGFVTPGRLRYHMAKHQGRSFFCDFCNKGFFTKNHLIGHIFERHYDERNYRCEICGKYFARRHFLEKHRIHHSTQLPKVACEYCPELFYGVQPKFEHIYSIHTQNPTACLECEMVFLNAGQTAQHHMLIHGKKIMCGTCDRRFPKEVQRDKHNCPGRQKFRYYCTICRESFRSKTHLEDHKSIHYVGEDACECGVCGASFFNEDRLIEHEKIHYNEMHSTQPLLKIEEQPVVLKEDKEGNEEENPVKVEVILGFGCQSCHASFEHENLLEEHKLECSVADEDLSDFTRQTFPCPYCHKKFILKFYLNKHLLKCPLAQAADAMAET